MRAATAENLAAKERSLALRVSAAVHEAEEACPFFDYFVAIVSESVSYHDVIVVPCMEMSEEIAEGFIGRWPGAKVSFFQRDIEEEKSDAS